VSSRRSRTRALAPRAWVRRSSVDHRIEHGWRCHLHDRPAIHRPAVQSISRRDPARGAALRVVARAEMNTLRCPAIGGSRDREQTRRRLQRLPPATNRARRETRSRLRRWRRDEPHEPVRDHQRESRASSPWRVMHHCTVDYHHVFAVGGTASCSSSPGIRSASLRNELGGGFSGGTRYPASEHLTGCHAERPGEHLWSRRVSANAQRSNVGWVTPRDRLHGRVVDRRPVVEMAPPSMLDSVVNGRAEDPVHVASARARDLRKLTPRTARPAQRSNLCGGVRGRAAEPSLQSAVDSSLQAGYEDRVEHVAILAHHPRLRSVSLTQ